MKRIALAGLAAATLSCAACAPAAVSTPPSQLLSAADIAEIRRIAPNADVSNLTVAQMGALALAIHSPSRGDGRNGGQIRAILN